MGGLGAGAALTAALPGGEGGGGPLSHTMEAGREAGEGGRGGALVPRSGGRTKLQARGGEDGGSGSALGISRASRKGPWATAAANSAAVRKVRRAIEAGEVFTFLLWVFFGVLMNFCVVSS